MHHGHFYSDTMFSNVRSTRGNTCAQVFTNDVRFTRVTPLPTKSLAGDALLTLIQDIGIPSALHTDDARELNQGKWG
jgi:hypothetical protein